MASPPTTRPSERVGIKGRWRIAAYRTDDPQHVNGLHVEPGAEPEPLWVHEYDNLICIGMDNTLASWLNGEGPTYGQVYLAVGTGTTAPAYGDTQLGDEVARLADSLNSRAQNVVQFQALFQAGVATDTLTECGVFVNGTAVANTGVLLNHATINEDKLADVVLILTVTFTIQ